MTKPLIVNPYAKRKFTKEELASVPDLRPDLSEAGKGIRAFADETQATGYGLLALGAQKLKDVTGATDGGFLNRMVDTGHEGYTRNIKESTAGRQAPNIARVEDIEDFGGGVDWAAYNLAKGLPQLGMLAGTGGVGAGVAKLAINKKLKDQAKNAITQELRDAAKAEIKSGIKRGAIGGGFAGGFGLEGGHAMGQALEAGVDPSKAANAAMVVGGINGALEFLPFYSVAKKLGRGDFAKNSIRNIIKNDKELSKRAIALATAKEASKRAGGAGLVGAGAEGVTEGLQELVNIAGLRWAEEEDMFADLDPEDWSQIKNAMAAGALIGGVAGGGAGVLKGPGQAEQSADVPPETIPAPKVVPPVEPTEPGTDPKLIGQPKITPMHPEKKQPAGPATPELEELPLRGELVDADIGTELAVQGEQAQLENPFIEGKFRSGDEALGQQLQLDEQRKLPAPNPRLENLTMVDEAIEDDTKQLLYREYVKKDGTAFLSEATASGAAAKRGLKNFNTVAIDGGFAIRDNGPLPGQTYIDSLGVRVKDMPFAKGLDAGIADHLQAINNAGFETIQSMSGLKEDYPSGARYSPNGYMAFPQEALTPEKETQIQKAAERAGLTAVQSDIYFQPALVVRTGITNSGKSKKEILQEAGILAAKEVGIDMEERTSHVFPSEPARFYPGDHTPAEFKEWLEVRNSIEKDLTKEAGGQISNTEIKKRWNKFTTALTQATTLESRARPPTFHSKVQQTVTAAPQLKMQGKQWQGWLAKQPGVKPEELEDLGLNEWLDMQEGAVSKEAVAAFIEAGGAQLEEVVLAEPNTNITDADVLDVYEITELDGLFNLVRDGEVVTESMESREEALELGREVILDDRTQAGNISPKTNYSSQQEPGGENYKEMLLTIPIGNKKDVESFNRLKELQARFEDFNVVLSSAEQTEMLKLREEQQKRANTTFESSHFDEVNVLAHVRLNERTDADGSKVLFVEEVQSDWHQAGRKKGYSKDIDGRKVPNAPFKKAWPVLMMKRMIRHAAENGFDKVAWTAGQVQVDRYDLSKQIDSIAASKNPDGTWDLLGKPLEMGEEFEQMVVGISEAELEQHVGKELANKIVSDAQEKLPTLESLTNEQMDIWLEAGRPTDFDKLRELGIPLAVDTTQQIYTGVDLEVGGEGMKNFYDKGLPRAMNKYLKQWGVKAELGELPTSSEINDRVVLGDETIDLANLSEIEREAANAAAGFDVSLLQLVNDPDFGRASEGAQLLFETYGDVKPKLLPKEQTMSAWTFPITQQMKDDVLTKGQPFYSEPTTPPINPHTSAQFEHDFTRIFDRGTFKQAVENGLLTVNETSPEGSPSGEFNKETNQITINLDRIGEGETPMSVLLHEGRHAGMGDVLGETLPLFHQDLLDLADHGNKDAQSSIIRSTAAVANSLNIDHTLYDLGQPQSELESEVKAIRRLIAERETGSDLLQEEDLAYYIQDAANTINLTAPGLYRRIINALKVWWAQSSVGQMFAQAGLRAELTPEMAVELAKVATKRAMIEPAMQQEEGVLASEPTDIASARKAKQLKDFKKKLGKDIDEKTAERMQEIADTSYKYKAGDVVLSASSGRRINIIGQTLIDDFREPLPPFKDYQARRKAVKARPQIPGYVIEYGAPGDVTRTTMAEWGIGGKATGPQSLKSKAQLPMDEASRMKRAEAMGFDTSTVWYHGTGKNVTEFKHGADYSLDGGWMGKGYYFGGSKSASRYATLRGSPTYKDADRAANVIPVYLKLQNPYIVTRGTIGSSALRESFINDFGKVAYQEVASRGTGTNDFINFNKHIADYLQEQGYDGIVLKFNTDTIQEVSIFDPSQARSINAAFDPKQTDSTNILHSMPSPTGFLKRWWGESTDTPLDAHNVDLAGKFRAHIIDNLATIDEKSTDVHKVAEVAKSKTSAEQSKINRMFLDPLVALAKTTGLNQKQLDEWLLARHVLLDDENWQNTQKRSWMVARDLAKALPSKLRKELDKRRISLTKDGVWIDKEGKEQKVPKASVQDRMVDLVNEYFQKAEELAADGTLGGQFTAWRDLQDSWIKIQAHSAGLYSPGKVDANGQLLPGQPKRANISNAPDAYDIYHGYSEDKVQHEALQAMAAKWDEMTKHQLDLLVEGGKITDEEKIAMREAHPHYVKSRRASSDNDKSFEFLNTVTASAGKPKVRAGTIEYDPVVHVMQNTIAQAHSNAQAGQQNQAALYLHREVTGNPEHWDGWFTEQKQEIHHLDTYGFLHDRPTSSPEAFDIPVTIMSDDGKSGKTVYLRPIPQNQKAKLFAAGMNKLGAQNQGAVAKVLGFGNKIVRNMAVTFSPAFLAANIFRDPATALYNLQATEGKDYTKDFLTGIETARLRSAIEGGVDKKNKGRAGLGQAWKILNSVYTHRESADPQHIAWVEEWEHAGGKQSFTQALKEMDDGWKSFESSLAIARTPGVSHAYKGLEWVEKYNIIVENISRFSAYSTVMEAWERGEISKWDTKEKAQREAAIISKELTTNFDRKGFSSQAIGLWHLFFNATVQGNVIVVRNLAKSKKLQKMVVGSVVTATMFDLLGRMSADEDDEGRNEWDNIPDYIKERNIILPFKIGGVYVKIPAPWVYNTVWRTGGMIGELAAGKRDVASVPVDMGLSLMNTFNPMASASLMQSLSPTILDPFVQAVENKNFAGNPIKPTSFPGAAALPESQLYWGSTPAAYIGLAQTLNALTGGDVAKSGFVDISPGVIHNFVNFFTAGVGKAAGQIYDLGSIPISDKEFEIKDVPILSTYATAPGKQVDVQLYHDRVAQVLRAQKAVDLYGKGKTRDIEKQRESRTKYAKELRLVNHVKDVERQLKSLRTRMRAAQGRKDTKRVKDLKSRLTSIQQKFNKTYEQRMGQTK